MTTLTAEKAAPVTDHAEAAPGEVRRAPRRGARVTDWAVTGPAGRSAAETARRVLVGDGCAGPAAGSAGPYDEACAVTGFDVTAELGRKGTRTLDRATALAVATVGRLGSGVLGTDPSDQRGLDTGLVLGTAMGSVQSTMEFTRDALTGERPYLVDPAKFPNTVMNFAAGQCAIRHGLRGPNATVCAGRVTGIMAVSYGLRMLHLGHANRVIVGAVEELSFHRAWLERRAHGDAAPQLLGEGCAVLVLERSGETPGPGSLDIGDIVAVATGMAPSPAASGRVLAGAIRSVLARLPDGSVVDYHAPYDAHDSSTERTATGEALGNRPAADVLGVTDVLGDTGAASAMFQTQVTLAALDLFPRGPGRRYGLVTSEDREGVVAALLVASGRDLA